MWPRVNKEISVPGYRKTKNVDYDKMNRAAQEEIEYQKSYARTGKARAAKEESARQITPSTARRRTAAYERVAPSAKPVSTSGVGSLLAGVRTLLQFGRKTKKGFDDLQGVGG